MANEKETEQTEAPWKQGSDVERAGAVLRLPTRSVLERTGTKRDTRVGEGKKEYALLHEYGRPDSRSEYGSHLDPILNTPRNR